MKTRVRASSFSELIQLNESGLGRNTFDERYPGSPRRRVEGLLRERFELLLEHRARSRAEIKLVEPLKHLVAFPVLEIVRGLLDLGLEPELEGVIVVLLLHLLGLREHPGNLRLVQPLASVPM